MFRCALSSSTSNALIALVAIRFLVTTLFLAVAGAASATVIQATATSYTGGPLEVTLQADDAAIPGDLVITLSISGPGAAIGDLRGFFLHVVDESLVSGLSVSGPDVTGSAFLANAVSNVTSGKYFNGIKMPCPCDLGVEFGTPGIGLDDLQQVTFTLSHATAALDVSFLANQQFGLFVGNFDNGVNRDGASKLLGVIPEPGAALLMGLGLVGLSSAGTRARTGA